VKCYTTFEISYIIHTYSGPNGTSNVNRKCDFWTAISVMIHYNTLIDFLIYHGIF